MISLFMKKRHFNNVKGHIAEAIAALLLILKGYRILARRYKVKSGEIDIIALRGERLAFVEVKLRSNKKAALEALTIQQQKRIINASKFWLNKHVVYKKYQVSYDYVIFLPWHLPSHNKYFYREM